MKPERNDPCPCGSGKKYKKCCGANASQQPAVVPAVLAGQAAAAFERGDFAASIQLSRQLLQTDPLNPQANHVLGLSLLQTRQLRPAITHLEKALRREPRNPFLLNNLAFACHGSGDLAAAERYARKALEADAQLPDAHNNLGQILVDAGKIDAAIAAYRQAVALQPENAVFHYNLGAALHLHKKERAEAECCYRQALARKQDFAPALANLGALMLDEEHWSEARELLERALALTPDDPKTLNSLGLALQRLKEEEGALQCFRRAIGIASYPAAYSNLGVLLENRGETDGAIDAYRNALAIFPEMRDVTANLFKLYYRAGRLEDAYELAISTTVLDSIRESFRAIFIGVLLQMGDHARVRNEWQVTKAYLTSQTTLPADAMTSEQRELIVAVLDSLFLPMAYGGSYSEEEIFHFHKEWGRLTSMDGVYAEELSEGRLCRHSRKIRIGYVSPDFRTHPVGHFMRNIIASHDRSKFEIFCYYNASHRDAITEMFEELVDEFVNVDKMDDKSLERQVRSNEVDILIDLAGHTAGNRLAAFGSRPAPLQMMYLGYPNTSGADYVDYWITDPHAHATEDCLHSEKLLCLPESFLCFGSFEERPLLSQPPAMKNGFITFGSFNNLRKLSSETVALWSTLLGALPNARLLLKDSMLEGKNARANILSMFRRHGIGPERLQLEKPVADRSQHLDQYNEFDIALDPAPYNGTTTTCEALWMGVPVLTLVGSAHRQRVSYSLLKNIGVEETIAFTEAGYVAIAKRLAGDLQSLHELRERVATKVRASILCDPKRFTRQFEAALRRAWVDYCSNNKRSAEAEH